jgi:hypothetical protein
VQDEINKAYDIFPKALIPKGWKITYFNPQYATKIDERVNLTKFEYDIYYLGQRQTSILNQYLKKYEINMIYVISIFRAAPIFLKKNIYSKGNWLKVRKKKLSKQHASKTKAYDWGFLNLFEKHINFNSKNKTFKYMQFIIPHAPSGIDKNGNLRGESSYHIESYQVIKKIGEILNKIQLNGYYDNTMILVVSDHGWPVEVSKKFSNKLKGLNPARIQPILLVKDFNAKGKIKTSEKFISNADIPSIICSNFKDNCGIDDANPVKLDLTRELFLTNVDCRELSAEKFKIYYQYKVKDNIFDANNWERIK